MTFIFSAVAVNDFFSGPNILLIYIKNFLKKTDGNIPFFVVFIPGIKFLKQNSSFVFAKCFCNLAFYKLEKVNFLRNKRNKFCPHFFDGIDVSCCYKAKNCFFIIFSGIIHVIFSFVMFCKCFCKFCFFKVDFYNMSIKVPYFWIACRTVVFCQCSECKFIVWIICKNACTKIFYNRFFMVFLEDINKGNERSVIKSSFLQRNDTTDIKCDNAVF